MNPQGKRAEAIWAIGGSTIPVAICIYLASLARRHELDDALIYARYVRNVIEGHGLVYNLGERFNGLTSPLYTYLSVLFAFVIRDVEVSQKVLAAICLTGTCVTVLATFRQRGLTPYGAAAALLIATNEFYYHTFGLETPLALWVASLCCYFYVSERIVPLAVCCAALVLTRGEWVFLVAILFGFYCARHRKLPPARAFVVFFALIVPHLAFNRLYFGSFLSHTLSAKIGQGKSGLWGSGGLLNYQMVYQRFLLSNGRLAVALGTVLALVSIPCWFSQRFVGALLLFAGAYSAFYLGLGIPNYHWYYAPYFYIGAVLGGCGLLTLRNALARIAGTRASAVVCVGLALLLAGRQLSQSLVLRTIAPHPTYNPTGKWLHDHTPESSKVACVEIGIIGWYSNRYIIDLLGLVNPHNAELLAQRDFSGWRRYYTPDYILVHEPRWAHEQGAFDLLNGRDYRPEPDYVQPGLVLWKRVAGAASIH